jgi:hypothetical protein
VRTLRFTFDIIVPRVCIVWLVEACSVFRLYIDRMERRIASRRLIEVHVAVHRAQSSAIERDIVRLIEALVHRDRARSSAIERDQARLTTENRQIAFHANPRQ